MQAINTKVTKEKLLDALAEYSTGRWDDEKIHYCSTGKDADLETCGQQGLEVVHVYDDNVGVVVHAFKTFVGRDVCLAEDYADDDEYEQAIENYMEGAHAVIAGTSYTYDWDGEDWCVYYSEGYTVERKENESPDELAARLTYFLEEKLQHWDDEMTTIDRMLNELAGYTEENPND